MEVCINPRSVEKFLCVPNQFVPYDDVIARKYIWRSVKMGILNKKHWKQWYENTKYTVVEKSGPIRHAIRNKRR